MAGAKNKPAPEDDNPLLALFRERAGGRRRGALDVERFMAEHHGREIGTKRYAWAIPTDGALTMIAKYDPIIEIGAGTGYWAKLLAARGVDIVAYDQAPPVAPGLNTWHPGPDLAFPVEEGGPEKIPLHPGRNLFLCWPPYDEPMASQCLAAFTGNHVIYIGEGAGGCTGDEGFFNQLEAEFDEIEEETIPSWQGIHDRMTVYRRKAPR